MCGRFENNFSPYPIIEQLKFHFPEIDFELDDGLTGKINIAPTSKILTLTNTEQKYKITPMMWGIKFEEESPLIFNSRIETIKEKSTGITCLIKTGALYQ